jgi:hypothetical protein
MAVALVLATGPLNSSAVAGVKVRKVHLKRDDIAIVKTAVGIATIIQVPDRPTSVVLGDTNAFKVEYLENAITIKPLGHSSKSNLYIYTDSRRFNVSLITSLQVEADYVVYLEPEPSKPDPTSDRWRPYAVEKISEPLRFNIKRLGKSGELLLLEFTITSSESKPISPNWIWITQHGRTVPIESLSLSGLQLTANTNVSGLISLRKSETRLNQSLTLEFRSPKPISVKLPEVSQWMK